MHWGAMGLSLLPLLAFGAGRRWPVWLTAGHVAASLVVTLWAVISGSQSHVVQTGTAVSDTYYVVTNAHSVLRAPVPSLATAILYIALLATRSLRLPRITAVLGYLVFLSAMTALNIFVVVATFGHPRRCIAYDAFMALAITLSDTIGVLLSLFAAAFVAIALIQAALRIGRGPVN